MEEKTKWVDLSKLPRWENGASRGQINWKESIGKKIAFTYEDITGNIEIINYNKFTNKYLVKYLNNTKEYSSGHLSQCKIGVLIGKVPPPFTYKYSEGQIIDNRIKILKQIKRNNGNKNAKGLSCQCLKCGCEWDALEKSIASGEGCPVCSHHLVKRGYNDLWSTNPKLAKMLANPEDGYNYSQDSNKKVDWICPDCGHLIKNKSINCFNRRGLSCLLCSDGVSYPNKIIRNLLSQIKIEYMSEFAPKWCKYHNDGRIVQGRYDVYFTIGNKKYIVEMDGGFHYKDNDISGVSKTKSKNIDTQKDDLAKNHGIEVIRIDSQISNIEYIKNNILHSELNKILNLQKINVDWESIDQKSNKSDLVAVCKMWMAGTHINEIEKTCSISRNTIIHYLKKGSELNLCNYATLEQRKVIHEKLILTYWNEGIHTTNELSELTQLSTTTVLRCLHTLNKNSSIEYNKNKLASKQNKKVICLNTNEIFVKMSIASNTYDINNTSICLCCKNKQKYAGKLPDGTPLHWMYYDEYIKLSDEEKQKLHNKEQICG